jgi:mRNA interferase YafQ
MYKVATAKQFRKDYKKLLKSGRFDLALFNEVVNTLAKGEILHEKYKDHSLKGSMKGLRECHLKPDLLLVYKIYECRTRTVGSMLARNECRGGLCPGTDLGRIYRIRKLF